MRITDLTPELADKMGTAYLESLIDMGVRKMNPQQKAIANGLHALQYLESARADLKKEYLSFATYELTNRLEQLEDMFAESKQDLSVYLKSFN